MGRNRAAMTVSPSKLQGNAIFLESKSGGARGAEWERPKGRFIPANRSGKSPTTCRTNTPPVKDAARKQTPSSHSTQSVSAASKAAEMNETLPDTMVWAPFPS
uniref:Uncharacterized protein n=1 Tax=Eutreptiella gymnastica TaxID=73025 RepID=A0A7S1NK84_9EUGL|mmetsp:Transcript_51481/g.91912  ORF Transcript_51481/g.91912 Transcript_51481/m.91912 type:complete len:103 (+) Transcript_51481:83-391(+)